MVIETKEGVWAWEDSDGSWKEYEDDVSKKIEAVFKANAKKQAAVSVGKDKFVSLADMKQFSFSGTDNKKGVNVKRMEKNVKVTWQWENGDVCSLFIPFSFHPTSTILYGNT